MGLKDFRIEFDNAERSYFAGQSVSGKVVLEIVAEKRIEALQLAYFGNGSVQWKAFSARESIKSSGGNNNKRRNSSNNGKTNGTYPKSVSAEEIYMNGKLTLVEKMEDDTSILLLPGKHEYPFEFRIPPDAPSTFLGPYGHVKYFVTATLKRPNSKRPHSLKAPLTVNGVLDLNTELEKIKTVGEESGGNQSQINATAATRRQSDYSIGEVKKFTSAGGALSPSCLCLNRSVGFSLRLPRIAFVPGEYVQFVAEMKNMSKVDVSGVTLSLIQETKYYAEDETKAGQKLIISSAKGPSVSAGKSEIWETNESDCLFLDIPSIPPTNLGSCNIIGVEYFLQLEMEIYGKGNIKGQLPILIGTIPLKSTFKAFTAGKVQQVQEKEKEKEASPSATNGSTSGTKSGKRTQSISEILGYPGLVDPSFQEAKTYTLSSTTSTLPPTGNFIKVPGKQLNHFITNGNGHQNSNGTEDEVDSDEEFSESRKHLEDADLNFVPHYAKYISVYGED